MYYPRLSGRETEEVLVEYFAKQVAELIELGRSFHTAMHAVFEHRYGGRFWKRRDIKSKVARKLQVGSVASRHRGKQLTFPTGA